MQQLQLDFTIPYQKHSPTSRAAAESLDDVTGLRLKVLNYIRSRPDGATDIEIQRTLNMAGDTQRPRRIELQAAKLIKPVGKRIPIGKKRESTIWKAI